MKIRRLVVAAVVVAMSGLVPRPAWAPPPTCHDPAGCACGDPGQPACPPRPPVPPVPPLCPTTLLGSKLPSNAWAATSTASGWYATSSAIITLGGAVVVGPASYGQVKSYMGGAFAGAQFTNTHPLGGTPGTPGPAANTVMCGYDGPDFVHGTQTLRATVAVVCTNTCAGL